MNTTIKNIQASDLVFISQTNHLVTDSKHVAEAFSKRHSDVLRKIEQLDCSTAFRSANFSAHPYTNQQNGETYNLYQMTKDGFMFLVMGFTGKKAAGIKEAYINAFNAMHERLFNTDQQPTEPKPQTNTIDSTQQALLLELINLRTSESVPELQQAVKNVVSGQFVKVFGCTVDQLPQDKYEEAIGVILNATIEGELLPTNQPNTNPHLEAELKKIAIAVDRYYYKEHGTNFIDGLLILKELHQYVPSDVHTLLKQLEGVLVSGWTHADESLCRLKAATTMLERWRGPKAKYNELLMSRL